MWYDMSMFGIWAIKGLRIKLTWDYCFVMDNKCNMKITIRLLILNSVATCPVKAL